MVPPLPAIIYIHLLAVIMGFVTGLKDVPEVKEKVADVLRKEKKRILVVMEDVDRLDAAVYSSLIKHLPAIWFASIDLHSRSLAPPTWASGPTSDEFDSRSCSSSFYFFLIVDCRLFWSRILAHIRQVNCFVPRSVPKDRFIIVENTRITCST